MTRQSLARIKLNKVTIKVFRRPSRATITRQLAAARCGEVLNQPRERKSELRNFTRPSVSFGLFIVFVIRLFMFFGFF